MRRLFTYLRASWLIYFGLTIYLLFLCRWPGRAGSISSLVGQPSIYPGRSGDVFLLFFVHNTKTGLLFSAIRYMIVQSFILSLCRFL